MQGSSQPSKDDWGWDNWADDFIIQAAGKVSNLLETVEGQLGIPDPAQMAEAVSKEQRIQSQSNAPSTPKTESTQNSDQPISNPQQEAKPTEETVPTQPCLLYTSPSPRDS